MDKRQHSSPGSHAVGLLCVLFLAVTASACGGGSATPQLDQWFVSPQGNDGNDCHTPLAPCLTIGETLERAVNGDVIYLAEGTYPEALSITKSVTISGELAIVEPVIDGSGINQSVININCWACSVDVKLAHLAIANGNASAGGGLVMSNADVILQNVTVRDNHASRAGGGIFVNDQASLTIEDSAIEMNEADGTDAYSGGGGIYNLGTLVMNNVVVQVNQAYDLGGGLNNQGEATLEGVIFTGNTTSGHEGGGAIYNSGSLSIQGGTFQQNEATGIGDGGAILNAGTVVLDGLTISYNQTSSNGGGIVNQSTGELTLTGSTVSNNQAGMGGAIANDGGQAMLKEVTLDHNSSVYSGGAVMNNNQATLTLINVTISANAAGDLGGGIANGGTDATLYAFNITIAKNTAQNSFSHTASNGAGIYHLNGAVTFVNVLLAENQGGNCGGQPFTASGLNLSSDGSCDFDGYGNLENVDPQLEPLADNGGRTQTHALRPESAAIDTGTAWLAPQNDQRDVDRPVDGDGDGSPRVDIGAFEFALTAMSGQATNPGITPGANPWTFELMEGASCRGGPGIVYPILAYAAAGEELPAEGRDETMNWFQVRLAGDILCWVSSDLGSLQGDPAWLELRAAPPTPTPVLPGPSDTPVPALSCTLYTTKETCEAHSCHWLVDGGGCHNP